MNLEWTTKTNILWSKVEACVFSSSTCATANIFYASALFISHSTFPYERVNVPLTTPFHQNVLIEIHWSKNGLYYVDLRLSCSYILWNLKHGAFCAGKETIKPIAFVLFLFFPYKHGSPTKKIIHCSPITFIRSVFCFIPLCFFFCEKGEGEKLFHLLLKKIVLIFAWKRV